MSSNVQSILPHAGNKGIWGKNRGKWKSQQASGVKPRTPLAWAATALPLSYNNWTTTNPHNLLYVLHRWDWMPQSHTWQPLSMYRQNSVRGQPKNSLHLEKNPCWVIFSLYIFRASCLTLEIKDFRCYEVESKKASHLFPQFAVVTL